jgi:hypothetical protein
VIVTSSGGGITASTDGYFNDGSGETVGGSLYLDNGNGQFQTNIGTVCSFAVDEDDIQNFQVWKVNGNSAGTDPVLTLVILDNVDVSAEFS